MVASTAVVILGAGVEGVELLNTLLNVSGIKILAVADCDPSSPGFEIAGAAGVTTTTNPVQLSLLHRADVILDASGDPRLVEPIRRDEALCAKLLSLSATRMVHHLVAHYRREQARMQQAERMTVMSNLLAQAAHELNNPLLIVAGYTALASAHLQRGALQELREAFGQIAEASERLRALTARFLKFARPAPATTVPCDVNACVNDVTRMMEHDLRRLNIRFVTSLAPATPSVLVNPEVLKDVLVNLVTNAREAITMSRQGSVITCETAVVRDEEAAGPVGRNVVQIRVHDDGPGIPPVHLPRIFEPLYTTKSPGPNTGMGLAFCYRIVTALGGAIAVESKAGQGTLFTVRLPVATPRTEGARGSS